MLYLRTGLPGSGKTLNTIREIELEFGPDPKHPQRELRTVYYYGIPDLDVSKLKCKWVEFDTPEEWYNLPDGSIIVIDEAQRIFGAQDGRKARPEKVTRFETHRHQGFDIFLITQHPSLLMSPVRKLVGKHVNMYRPYGGKRLMRHEYEFCIDSPEKRSNFKMAQERRIKLDPKYFGVYKSATVHTHTFKLPNYVWYIPALLLFIFGGVVYVYKLYAPADSDKPAPVAAAPVETAVASASPSLNDRPASAASSPQVVTPEQFVESFEPRIADVPATAPRYDRLTEPKAVPRLICAASWDPIMVNNALDRGFNVGSRDGRQFSCQCYTQQMTRYSTSADFCLAAVEYGQFDDTRPDRSQAAGSQNVFNADRQASTASATGRVPAAQMPKPYSSEVVRVGSGHPGHLW
ncbi:zonular occludens toxin domain-containing protein [Stutzerimonas stutzeri]|uniref:zonular occludens toxin domain-containing protein n=1 Tax=Stutzerimonas stutzeri TaxID=316 RepID=UPI00371F53F6